MSLKCSLFGCKYGDSEVHREREENGSEVVTTIRETQTCSRCGDVRVVSENKEVTTMETAADIVAGDLKEESPGETPPAAGPEGKPPDTTTAGQGEGSSPAGGGTVIPDAETDEGVTAGSDEAPAGSPSAPEAAEDDAVILDGDADGDREPGEWPEQPDDGADSSTDDDGEVLTDDAAAIDGATQFGSPDDVVSVPDSEFHCPECEYTASVESSSLREGDYCPECHHGSLEQRPE
jgi:ssDNA-binding Zn-finger/Zn-ribbon topoisomerase 1